MPLSALYVLFLFAIAFSSLTGLRFSSFHQRPAGCASRHFSCFKEKIKNPGIQTIPELPIFFHPDYTVGTGFSPVRAFARGLAGLLHLFPQNFPDHRRWGLAPRPEDHY
jgi:hypothetical protein